MTDVFIGPGDSAPSDAELILEVRGGDLEAFGALYQRHAPAARKLARQYVRSAADADDVVADAFDRVLRVLQQGGGPDLTFRAYLFTVVRRLAVDVAKGARRTRPTADEGTFEWALGAVASNEDPALVDFERSIVARAYQSLPERWQAVLWYTEIEELSPAEIAPMLGLTPNGVSALAYRAREGLRVGYLQEHLTHVPSEGCAAINPLLGGYVRGGLSKREVGKVEAHLETCGDCRTLVLELGDVAHGMKGIIAPLVLGVAGLAVAGALPVGGIAVGSIAAGSAASGTAVGGAAVGGTAVGGTAVGGAGSAGAATTGVATTGVATTGVGTTGVGTTGAATGAATTGMATTGMATTGAAAGAGGVGAGGAAAGGAVVGSAAGAGSAAAGTAAATTAAVATTTVAGGATVAAAAGAVAVATVGVVTVLTAIQGIDVPAANAAPTPTPMPSPSIALAVPAPLSSTEEPDESPFSPVRPLVSPANLDVDFAGMASPLAPRTPQLVSLTVANTGGTTAEDTVVQLALPEGLKHSPPQSPSGAGPGTDEITVEGLLCSATETPNQVQCNLGSVEPGSPRVFSFPVEARNGGSYAIGGQVWASNAPAEGIALPPATVSFFGAELTAKSGDPVVLENPGAAWVPVAVTNTGDVSAVPGWGVVVTPPAGMSAVGSEGELGCTRSEGRDWICRPALDAGVVEPGGTRTARLRVVADGATPAGTANVMLAPILAVSDKVVTAQAAVEVAPSWRGATAGAGAPQAVCRAQGGISAADAAVVGTFTNTSPQTVTVRLDAAGSSASSDRALAPGESAKLTAPDGMRVPAGSATYTLETVVAGSTYSTTIPAGSHGSVDCYSPPWGVSVEAAAVNAGGTVRIDGTITNTTSESLDVSMAAAGKSTETVSLAAGATKTLAVNTGATSVSAGAVQFRLQRSVPDVDGDLGVVATPPTVPTASYATARLAPQLAANANLQATECQFDPALGASVRTFEIPLDNTASTLPVTFAVKVAGETRTKTVPGGELGSLSVRVPWGAKKAEVLADGTSLGTVDVTFESCAQETWPGTVDVAVATQCVEGEARIVADVSNNGSRAWTGSLIYAGKRSDEVRIAAGGTAQFVIGLGDMRAPDGETTVQLEREFEGKQQSVTRSYGFEGTECIVIDPSAGLELGPVKVHKRWSPDRTSWRDVTVVLDNSGSNVPVDFRVVGPNGLDHTQSVAAGKTEKIAGGAVKGRHGATFTVQAGDWSTKLFVEPFTGAPAWCAAPIEPGKTYAAGDVASWRGANYRYVGKDADIKLADHGRHRGSPRGHGWWRERWERVSSCEYREL